MSIDLLKEAEALVADGVARVENLFSKHAVAASAQNDVGAELEALKQAFADLQARVSAGLAGLANFVKKPTTLEEVKALIASL